MSDTLKLWKKGSEVRTGECFEDGGEAPEDAGYEEVSLAHLDSDQMIIGVDGAAISASEFAKAIAASEAEGV